MEIWGKPNEKARELINYLKGRCVEAVEVRIKNNEIRGEQLLGVYVSKIPRDKHKEILSKIDEIAGENFDYRVKNGALYFERRMSSPVGSAPDF